jgi:hypothetical protein
MVALSSRSTRELNNCSAVVVHALPDDLGRSAGGDTKTTGVLVFL